MSPSDKGMYDMSSSHHCSDTPLLKHLGGVQVGYNGTKTPGRGTGRILSYAVPQAEVSHLPTLSLQSLYISDTNVVICTELLYIFWQQEYLMRFKT
jgi:hypothetical protein